jgi:hypothetical protein
MSELHTSDLKAITRIVTNSSVYQKAPFKLADTQRVLGKGSSHRGGQCTIISDIYRPGLLGVELEEHKRQVGFAPFS